ncbi:glycosyltransferase [Tunturiibacter gelidoferens]|uniref:Glycosyltransferase involved in cell wall biosynthesis n=1 Tax=Tunturiibacter gelidiferens TaxID=3069689 RepID=A0ACC5NUZ1_9BACT|nr:glycosyltransferase [Edaphobacter lichenicola]MBB5338417.1 glycosyltransferase involved in cell wall biosynthesis [Edaphobacter lichenicola]
MLRSRGEEVSDYTLDNAEIKSGNLITVGLRSVWNTREADRVKDLIRSTKPDLMKVDNFFPLLSPSVFDAAKAMGVPTALSVRNYRLICPSANLFRDGHVCTTCVGSKIALAAIQHRCYRQSYLQSAAVVASNAYAHLRGVWTNSVDRYIAVSSFVKQQLVAGGFPEERIIVKPNFISDSGIGDGSGGYGLYVGRLTEEKGLRSLLNAWPDVPPSVCLKIIGDGPLESLLRQASEADPRIEYLGRKSLAEVCEYLAKAAFLVFPSEWYEPFGRTIVEAYCKGTPVIAALTPPMKAMVDEGVTGLLYNRTDKKGLASAVSILMADSERLNLMRERARAKYLAIYTEDQNYRQLMDIFHQCIDTHHSQLA